MRALSIFLAFSAILVSGQQPEVVARDPIIHVATALNHLTVLEFHEPVTMAAAGSSDFQIERESNKVFIKPVKSGAATDLFVWTQSRRFAYELETTDEVKNMNFAIDNAPPQSPKPAENVNADQLADVILTRALLGAEDIAASHSKVPKNRVNVRIEQVLRTRSTVYIHYTISNNTKHPYHASAPQAFELRPGSPKVSLRELINTEVDASMLEQIGDSPAFALPVVHTKSEPEDLQPGETTKAVLAIRRDLQSPALVQLDFGNGLKATIVL